MLDAVSKREEVGTGFQEEKYHLCEIANDGAGVSLADSEREGIVFVKPECDWRTRKRSKPCA